ncbi:uncharacterized protein ARB_00126 [Trichophyton benhamiae CBS 112371]|uniref:PhoD-like phosphatase domain-containing protein n=1 Tax=Arthroderma benhamiae (strain ATCC MYA-4681 / CBS 112371) TaxID=663331 RepID=D4AVB7_ARTBC|nr:uncharacterized protein ARB_00126 [Trichophyton benhamiae CBS 112371]EFE33039.1 hypothetical protein ARB_00126 [Trichophyton benhamiae CBS 112371]
MPSRRASRPYDESQNYSPTQRRNGTMHQSGYPDQPQTQDDYDTPVNSRGQPSQSMSFAHRAKERGQDELPYESVSPNGAQSPLMNTPMSPISTYQKANSQSPSIQQNPASPDINSPPHSQASVEASPVIRQNSQMAPRQKKTAKEWAPARSPLKKLELTLNDISKEEKRARVEEAEMLLREARAGLQGKTISRDAGGKPHLAPESARNKENAFKPSNIEEAGLLRSLSTKQKDKIRESAQMELKKPDPDQVSDAQAGGFEYERTHPPPGYDSPTSLNQPAKIPDNHHGQLPGAPLPKDNQIQQTRELFEPPAGETCSGAIDSEASQAEDTKNGPSKQKHASVSFAVPPPTPPPVSEWMHAVVGRLCLTDFDLRVPDMDRDWRGRGTRGTRNAHRGVESGLPRVTLKSTTKELVDLPNGPCEREIWRGSIMIVTQDSASFYDTPPTLRIFSQPKELIPPPPSSDPSDHDSPLAPEYVDPIAGLGKIGRNGNLLYVKPVDHIEEGLDLCYDETEEGLFERSPSQIDYAASRRVSIPPDTRIQGIDGEMVGKYKVVKASRVYIDPGRDTTFWRFNLEIELGDKEEHVAYRINNGSVVGFWVPARGQAMNILYHTGNGFGMSVDTDKYSGPDPMWRDALNAHQSRPFHVMIGGGSQINNNAITVEADHFRKWIEIKGKNEKHEYPLNLDIKGELEEFYLENYAAWFSQGLFGMACSQIPMVNMWDDNDIISGYGSFTDELMKSPVFSGLGNVAFKYYLLFQHQTAIEETEEHEPSWLLGSAEGPYIRQKSRNLLMNLGERIGLLAIDCRTERSKMDIMIDESYDLIWDRCHQQIVKGEMKHLLVLVGVPVAFPRLSLIEGVLKGPAKALGRNGVFRNASTKIENTSEKMDDQWTSKQHKLERKWLIEDLQELAAEKSMRVIILGGGANLAAVGQFYSDPSLQIPKDKDYRYMPNVISSPIVDAPLSEIMTDTLNKRNKVHTLDLKTVEDMRAMFWHDVEGRPRNNKRLLPRRNWCSIREYTPGRTLSMSRGDRPANGLMRRLSLKAQRPQISHPIPKDQFTQRMSYDEPRLRRDSVNQLPEQTYSDAQLPQNPSYADADGDSSSLPNKFVRRRTDLSIREIKQAAKGGPDQHHFINIEGGLHITFNCEVKPQDPAGITTPYHVLIPALSFDGEFEPSVEVEKKQWWKLGHRKNNSSVAQIDGAEPVAGAAKAANDEQQQQQQQQQPQHLQQVENDAYHNYGRPITRESRQGYYEDEYDDDINVRGSPRHAQYAVQGRPGELSSPRMLPQPPPQQTQGKQHHYFNAAAMNPANGGEHGYEGIEAYRPRKKKWLGIL